MVRSPRLSPRLVAAAAATAFVLAGCSSGSSHPAGLDLASSPGPLVVGSPSASASPSTPSPSPTVTPKAKPKVTVKPKVTKAASKPPVGVTAGHYAFPVRCASSISYGHSHHDYPATDIFAGVGCSVVAPVTGYIDEVSHVDTWSSSANLGSTRGGLSFSIVGIDGVRYYGSHLSSLLASLKHGVHVLAGQLIGKVGRTGDARGGPSHLHFGISWPTGPGIWWVRRGEVYPWPYLDAWRKGLAKSPVSAVAARHAQVGNAPCSVDC